MSKELAEDKNKVPAVMDMDADSGQGFDNMTHEDFVLPFLRVIQKSSPIVDEDEPSYNPDAKVGEFYNSASGERFGTEVTLVDCFYERTFIEWKPNQGGFVGIHTMDSFNALEKDESGRGLTEDGNEVFDTRNHYVILIREGHAPQPLMMTFKSTQIKKSKTWNYRAQSLLTPAGNPRPRCGSVWTFESVSESNDKGNWKGLQIKGDPVLVEDPEVYVAAKEFGDNVAAGKVKVDMDADNDKAVGGSGKPTNHEKEEF